MTDLNLAEIITMDIIEKLQDKNNTAAYRFLLGLEATSAESNELYDYFEKF